jgi:hypothetical protein
MYVLTHTSIHRVKADSVVREGLLLGQRILTSEINRLTGRLIESNAEKVSLPYPYPRQK